MQMRTSKPNGVKYYIRQADGGWNGAIDGSPKQSGAGVLANCVGYANGRFNEIIGESKCKYQLVSNAENFIERAKEQGLKVVDEPTLGGIMVFQKGTLSSGDGAGHVMVVEKFNSKDQVYTSESAYGSTPFYNSTRSRGNGNWGMSSSYKYRGCIVNPAIGEVRYTEPTPPAPKPEPSLRKATTQDCADIWAGKYGNYPEREQNLRNAGIDPTGVQDRINAGEGKPGPAPKPSGSIEEGDKVKFTGTTTYGGARLDSWTKGYIFDVIEVRGERVVIGKGSAVTAAVHIRDCQKV